MKKIISFFASFSLIPTAFAHAGDHANVSWWHSLEAYHIAPVIGFLIIAGIVVAKKKAKKVKVKK